MSESTEAGQPAPPTKPLTPPRASKPARSAGRRVLSFTLHLLAGLMGLVLFGLGFVVFRLTQGPIRLDMLNPRLEYALVEAGLPPLKIESTAVAWDTPHRRLSLNARNVRLTSGSGAGLLLPGLGVGLKPSDLIKGQIRPTDVTLTGLHVTLIRDRADRWQIPGLDALPAETAGADDDPTAFLARLAAGETGLSALTSLRLDDAALTIDDRFRGKVWQAKPVDLHLFRTGRALNATGMLALNIDGTPLTLRAEGRHELGQDAISLSLAFVNLKPARLAAIDPLLAGLTAAELTIDGQLSANFRRDGTLTAAKLEARMGRGRILLPGGQIALPLRQGAIKLHLATPDRSLTLDHLTLDLDGPQLEAMGRFRPTVDQVNGTLWLRIRGLKVAALNAWWPKGVADGAREWITTNLADGIVNDAWATANIGLVYAAPDAPIIRDVAAGLDLSGFTVHYFRPLPPIVNVNAQAAFDGRNFAVDVKSGRLDNVLIGAGQVAIDGLDVEDQRLTLGIDLAGPISDILTVIDHEPLGYAKGLGIAPDAIKGTATGHLKMDFPLLRDLPIELVELTAEGSLSDVSAKGLLGSRPIDRGAVDFSLDTHGMTIAGKARLDGTPVDLRWKESFDGKGEARTVIDLTGTLDEKARSRFGLPLADYLTGPTPVEARYRVRRGAVPDLAATIDLKPAQLVLPWIGYDKPPDAIGRAKLNLSFPRGRSVVIDGFSVTAPDLAAEGRVDLTPKGDFEALRLDAVKAGAGDFALTMTPRANGGYALDVTGHRFDLRSLLAETLFNDAPPNDALPNDAQETVASGPPVEIKAVIDQVLVRGSLALSRVSATALHDGRHLAMLTLDARTGDTQGADEPLTIRFLPQDGGTTAVSIKSGNAGATGRFLDVMPNIRRGNLVITGIGRRDAKDRLTIDGSIDLRDFKILKAPFLARLLNAMSLPGFGELMGSDGLELARFSAEFSRNADGITFKHGRAAGSAFGMTIEGRVDTKQDRLDLRGAIVPVYFLNQIIGGIPLVGTLLTGGEGKGLFSANYHATGKIDDPNVAINPLSLLAPGIVREIFFQDGD